MNNQERPSVSSLPDYITRATPNPLANRVPWYKTTAQTYAGIFLWFVFWDTASKYSLGMAGLGLTLAGIIVGAVICHFLFFLVPGLLGMRTGLPLYIVGTSTFGAVGGLLMPGFLMGVLQFGWLGVNAFWSTGALVKAFHAPGLNIPICVVFTLAAALVGMKGIQYVARVATYLPLIPFAVLIVGLVVFLVPAADYVHPMGTAAANNFGSPLNALPVMVGFIVGFFATAGAAGVDICTSNRDARDVSMGGLVGIVLAVAFTAGISVIVVAGARASGLVDNSVVEVTAALKAKLSEAKLSGGWYTAMMIGLPLAAFPGACFSSFIAANSFKTTMPKVNPFISVGIGAIVSIVLAVTGAAGHLVSVFGLIGASFGPIVGAMVVDYFLAGRKWSGPRAGFNPAGWIAWLLGFIVGILDNEMLPEGIRLKVHYCSPVAAFIVGAVVYFICAKAGLLSKVVPLPEKPAPEPAPAPAST